MIGSMEKLGNFYKRDSLTPDDVTELIQIWEGEAGESFTDYCSFSRETDKRFLKFLEEDYPVLYAYRNSVADTSDWIEGTIQYVFDHCIECCKSWVPESKWALDEKLYPISFYPLSEFILEEDTAWETFVEFFTNTKNTCSGTPYIDCYGIRKEFENGEF